MAKKRIFTQTEIDQILDKFDNGQSMESLQKEFHTRKIRDILTENNREIKQGGKRINSGSKYKYTFNESYFEKIDSVEKAYWLGFIYADGYITRKTSGQAHLCLCLSEEEPINKFKKAINTNKPTNSFDAKNSYNNTISKAFRITIISDKITKFSTIRIGLNKTLNLPFHLHNVCALHEQDTHSESLLNNSKIQFLRHKTTFRVCNFPEGASPL